MIKKIKKQTNKTIIKFLQKLGGTSHTYSEVHVNFGPFFSNNKTYVYATEKETAIVMFDLSLGVELADEICYRNEAPLYFSESYHRESPVWQLALTCELFRQHMTELEQENRSTWGVLVTSCEIINYEDMLQTWDLMNIIVIDKVKDLDKLQSGHLPLNSDVNLPFALSVISFCQTKFKKKDIDKAIHNVRALMLEENNDFSTNDFPQVLLPPTKAIIKSNSPHKSYTPTDGEQYALSFSLEITSAEHATYFTDGPIIVSIAEDSKCLLELDRFKCYVYTASYYPMCNSAAFSEVSRGSGNSIAIKIPCHHIWMPGNYLLMISDEEDGSLTRIAFCIDEELACATDTPQTCLSYGNDDILTTFVEEGDQKDDWKSLATHPGSAALRLYALKAKQFECYNDYRMEMGKGKFNMAYNLLISIRDKDFPKEILCNFQRIVVPYCEFRHIDCSILYDISHPNPYEQLNNELECGNQVVLCLTNISAFLNTGGKVIVKKITDKIRADEKHSHLWIVDTQQEINAVLDTFPSLRRFFLTDSYLELQPYTDFEIVQAFYDYFKEEDIETPPEVMDKLTRSIRCGYRQNVFVSWSHEDIRRFVVDKIRPRYVERSLKEISIEHVPSLSLSDIPFDQFTHTNHFYEESIRELQGMVGLDSIKQGIITMANTSHFYMERRRCGLHTSNIVTYHCIFTGNPGTGKTTVARMLGKIYHSLGILSRGEVISMDRTRLVGRYIGETEENMKQVLEEARGNVLFIDEAYTLYDGSGDRKDFGGRVIDCLLTVLTQPNPDMLIIFAGYPKEMAAMLSTNPGLQGRFPYKYHFEDYSAEQLTEIACRLLIHDDYILTEDATTLLKTSIAETYSQRTQNFGNARWVEQFVKNGIIPAMADRILISNSKNYQHIEADDIRKAYEKFNLQAIGFGTRNKVGF